MSAPRGGFLGTTIPGTTLADALDGVRWDYAAARPQVSPLVATARWFQDFPWDGEEEAGDPEAGDPGAGGAAARGERG